MSTHFRFETAGRRLIELMGIYDGGDPGPGSVASPKLDGVYAKATKDGVFSKSGKRLNLPHVQKSLEGHFKRHPESELEGEMFRKGHGVEKIVSAVARGGDAAKHLQLHVFPKEGQKTPLPHGAVRRVAGTPVRTAADVQKVYERALKRGHEGVVVRGADGVARKKKPRDDAEWEAVGSGSTNKNVVILKHGDRTFRVQARKGLKVAPGDKVQVSYSGRTANGVPKAAVAERVRNNQDFENTTAMNTHDLNTPARSILGESFFAGKVRNPYVRVIELARGESPEDEIARDRRTLKKIAAGAAIAGGVVGTVLHHGATKGRVIASKPVKIASSIKKPASVEASFWGKKRRGAAAAGGNVKSFETPASGMGITFEEGRGYGQNARATGRDNLSKVRDVAIIGGAGAAGAGALMAGRQARKAGRKVGALIDDAGRTVQHIRDTVTPHSVAQEGLKMVKKKAKEQAAEYFPTVGKALRVLKRHVFSTPASGLIDFATMAPERDTKVREQQGKFVDHWKVASGLTKGYDSSGNEVNVGMAHPAVLKSLYRKANHANKWGTRAANTVKDVKDVVVGNPRARDASGRKKKREWEKSWATDAVKKGALVAGIGGYGIALKRSPRLAEAHHAVVGKLSDVGRRAMHAVSNLEAHYPALAEFLAKKNDDHTAEKIGATGAAVGAANGAVFGGISAAHSKQADEFFALHKRMTVGPTVKRGSLLVADRNPAKPFKDKGKFGGGERLARAEHEAGHRLKKTVRNRSLVGGLGGAALLGGLSYAASKASENKSKQRRKNFETPASMMGVQFFDSPDDDTDDDSKKKNGVWKDAAVNTVSGDAVGTATDGALMAGLGIAGAAAKKGKLGGVLGKAATGAEDWMEKHPKLSPLAVGAVGTLATIPVAAALLKRQRNRDAASGTTTPAKSSFNTPAREAIIEFALGYEDENDYGVAPDGEVLALPKKSRGPAGIIVRNAGMLSGAALGATAGAMSKHSKVLGPLGVLIGSKMGHVMDKTRKRRQAAKVLAEAEAAGNKTFSTPARALLIEFDDVAAHAGWDVRDPRGRSVRVFAPGSRARVRREKAWHEEVDNERKLWKAGMAGAALAGGTAGVVLGSHMPKRPPVSAKKVLVGALKKKL